MFSTFAVSCCNYTVQSISPIHPTSGTS
jgi:hypothetical protein